MKQGDFEAKVLQRLDVLISLRLEAPIPDELPSVASKVDRLIRLGLAPAEVASVLGKPTKYVTAILAKRKARSKLRK